MTLDILHTSDWHLGARLDSHLRDEEHEVFLKWLSGHLRDRPCDLLIVAGNALDSTFPDPASLQRLWSFLADAVASGGARQAIVLGGSADAAALIDAPRGAFEALGIRLLGEPAADPAADPRSIIPIQGADGAPVAVAVAVPFVHPFLLGVRASERDPARIKAALQQATGRIFSALADQARLHHPGLPLIACGHLPIEGMEPADAGRLGLPGLMGGGIDPSALDPRFDFVALGHARRMSSLDAGRVWSCGAPLALSLEEAHGDRHILRVEISASGRRVEPIAVPRPRELITLSGTPGELLGRLVQIDSGCPLPPWLSLEVEVEQPSVEIEQLMQEALGRFPARRRPQLLRVAQRARGGAARPLGAETPLDPRAVFERLVLERTGQAPDDALAEAFERLLTDDSSTGPNE